MNHWRKHLTRPARWLTLAFVILALAPAAARAQYGVYGGYGGYGGYGYGGYGYGGYGGYYPGGYGGYGYGYGYPGFGYGGYGFGNTYNPYLSQFYAVGPSVPGYGNGFGYGYGYGAGTGFMSPLTGAGLTPLGLQSALIETAIIRGSGGYRLRYPTTVAPALAPGRYSLYGP